MTVIVFGLLFGIGAIIWYFFHLQLTNALRYIRVGELWVDTLMYGGHHVITIAPDDVPEHAGPQYIEAWRTALANARVQDIGTPELKASTYMAVPAARPFFAALIALMATWVFFKGPNTQYRRKMNLEGLIKEQAKSFPMISPFVKFNPRDLPFRVVGQAVPSKLPMFAEALAPEEWIAYHEIQMQNNQLDVNQAYSALMEQLGERWQGPAKLPIHVQGLFAAFALRHARKRKDSEELLGEMALSWSPEGGLKLSPKLKAKIRKIVKDPKLGGSLLQYADQHAYTTTALLRCLQRARQEGGVLAPSSFVWLRGEDRNLWYPLNNLGRRSYHAEAVGALVHYTNELIAGQKIPTPRFDDVIRGIEETVTGPAGRPIPPLDKTPSASIFKKK